MKVRQKQKHLNGQRQLGVLKYSKYHTNGHYDRKALYKNGLIGKLVRGKLLTKRRGEEQPGLMKAKQLTAKG